MTDLAPAAVADIEELAVDFGGAADLDRAVHTARKGTKRLRAFLRLARRSIGTDMYRTENAALRDTARLIAPARDALVLIETAQEIGASRAVLGTLERLHLEEMARLETGVRAEATGRLDSIASRWRVIEWRGPEVASIRAGLARTYSRALADFTAVQSQPSARAFHSWRRRVKYVRYQLEAVGAPGKLAKRWFALGDELGWEHDLTVLIGVCGEYTADDDFRAVAARSRVRREELRTAALDSGGRLTVLKPGAFVESVVPTAGLEGH
ncbi:MAG: CHAD domain-containing protein [Acidimicrobiia bacterium]